MLICPDWAWCDVSSVVADGSDVALDTNCSADSVAGDLNLKEYV